LSSADTNARRTRSGTPVAVQHRRQAGEVAVLEFGVVGKIGDRLVVEIDHLGEVEGRIVDRLVAAELAIGRLQLGEVEAMERFDAGGRFRIRHGGRDQVVEIDVLDVERLAHMRASVAQDVHDFVSVGGGIEVGFHRVGPGGHLAQRQRGGEYLDQNGVHRPEAVPAGAGSWPHSENQTSI